MNIDEQHIWHPYAKIPNTVPSHLVESADGVYLNFKNGNRVNRWNEFLVVNDSWIQ